MSCQISSFAATVHTDGSDECTLSYTCSRGYTDVAKYLIMEKKIYDILGTCIVTHCLATKGLDISQHLGWRNDNTSVATRWGDHLQ